MAEHGELTGPTWDALLDRVADRLRTEGAGTGTETEPVPALPRG
ncbi:hypothetical protein ABZZ17_19085 [Streptomyces sp. NPDC006512]